MENSNTETEEDEKREMEELDSKVRSVLAKKGEFRTYDDLLILKTRVMKMDFMRSVISRLHPRQIDELCISMNLELFVENQYVFHQGDVGDKFYLVLTGSCDVVINQKVGSRLDSNNNPIDEHVEKVVFRCHSGQQFGERALDFDEVRAASIRATCITELISLTQVAYRKMLKSGNDYDLGTSSKANVIRIMSKSQDKRSHIELQEVVEYLGKRIAFFKQFDVEQQLELCKVAEIVNVWGKTALFKQGSVGEAFYVILTGSVDIWVSNADDDGNVVDTHISSLYEGASFGERALESETNLRQASVWTSDSHTDLLLIGRADFKRVVTEMRKHLTRDKIKLIRSTQLLCNLDLNAISDLAKYLEPKIYRLNTPLYRSGESMKNVYFIHKGEVQLERNVFRSDMNTNVSAYHGRICPGAILGDRLFGVSSFFEEVKYEETAVANTYCTVFVLTKNDIFNHLRKDTVKRVSEMISLYEYPSTHLWDSDSLNVTETDLAMKDTWSRFKKKMHGPEKNKVKILDYFRNVSQNKNYVKQAKEIERLNSPPKDLFAEKPTGSLTIDHLEPSPFSRPSSKVTDRDHVASSPNTIPKPHSRSSPARLKKQESGGVPGHGQNNLSTEEQRIRAALMSTKSKLMHFSRINNGNSSDNIASYVAPIGDGVQRLPFSVIHIHRNKASANKQAIKSRKLVKCFLRLCGSMTTIMEAKENVEFQLFSCKTSDDNVGCLLDSMQLEWKRFNGFDSMPLQYVDHFIIYCRSTPVEYVSFTPSGVDLLEVPFAPSCKPKGQKYACVSLYNLDKAAASKLTNGANGGVSLPKLDNPHMTSSHNIVINNSVYGSLVDDVMGSLYLKEIGVVSEVHAACFSRMECIRYGVLTLNPSMVAKNSKILTVPLFVWLTISQELINIYDVSRFKQRALQEMESGQEVHTLEELVDIEDQEMILSPEKKRMAGSVIATEELKNMYDKKKNQNLNRINPGGGGGHHSSSANANNSNSINANANGGGGGGGGGSGTGHNNRIDPHINSILSRDIKIQKIVEDIRKHGENGSHGHTNLIFRTNSPLKATSTTKHTTEIIKERAMVVKTLIESRKRIIDLNDEICNEESIIEEKLKKSLILKNRLQQESHHNPHSSSPINLKAFNKNGGNFNSTSGPNNPTTNTNITTSIITAKNDSSLQLVQTKVSKKRLDMLELLQKGPTKKQVEQNIRFNSDKRLGGLSSATYLSHHNNPNTGYNGGNGSNGMTQDVNNTSNHSHAHISSNNNSNSNSDQSRVNGESDGADTSTNKHVSGTQISSMIVKLNALEELTTNQNLNVSNAKRLTPTNS